MIDKIAKLLALAENAGTEAEAEAAFAKAQALASAHAIDLEVARRAAAPAKRETPIKRTIQIGEKGKHANKPLINLFSAVAHANDVELLIAFNSTYVIAHGMPSDIDMTEAVWSSLAAAMVRFGNAHVKNPDAAWRKEIVSVWSDRKWDYIEKPVTAQGARRSFYDGFTSRIGMRLIEARDASIQKADADHFHNSGADGAAGGGGENLPSSMALVLKEKRAEVREFMYDDYRRKYGRAPRGSWNGGSNAAFSGSSRSAGSAAADRVNLSGRRSIAS